MRNEKKEQQKKADFIVLIDDDEEENEMHLELISQAGAAKETIYFNRAPDGICYLAHCLDEYPVRTFPTPNLVFLDVNMPFNNGFQVMDEFRKLEDPYNRKEKIKFVLLTGVANAYNSLLAHTDYKDLVLAFIQKPLQFSIIHEVLDRYYSPVITP